MPLPSKDSLLPWQYTFLDDHTFSDGRTPDAATLGSFGTPCPKAVIAAPRPTATGPWWLPQDLAHGGHLVVTVLHTSKIIGALPVIERRLLDAANSVDQVVTFDVWVPKYASRDPSALAPEVRALRRQLRRLLASDQTAVAVPDLEAVADAINDLHHSDPALPVTEGRLALLRFRHPDAGQSADWETHPALLLETSVGGSSSDAADDYAQQNSIHLNQAEGMRRLGLLKAERGDLDGARQALETAAEDGDVESMIHLGQLNRRLLGADNQQKALHWFRAAAEQGHPVAALFTGMVQAELGQFDGDDGAEVWWQRAHDRGIPEAARLVGNLNAERGDAADAERWWRIGTEQGDAAAALNIGLLRAQNGDSWPQDAGPDSAEEWWQRAYELGSSRAACELGRRRIEIGILDGADGADVWLRRAWDAGVRPAAFLLGVVRTRQNRLTGTDSALSWLEAIEDSGLPEVVDLLRNLRRSQQTASRPSTSGEAPAP